ncbi:MAG: hypothetical protein KDA79_04975 [Planctomycetaceae bacterium]|nr:hypothetical protein [Planctomycetaceae bacterium]
MPRFALLLHDWPVPHRDLLLEQGETALTWRLPLQADDSERAAPESEIGQPAALPAEQIAPHRLHYLTWEGPVSGGRGEVKQLDSGPWQLVAEADGELVFDLGGNVLSGRFRLRCIDPPAGWLLEQLVE